MSIPPPPRARKEAVELMETWLTELGRAAKSGTPSAYAFVMGSCAELLSAFDIPMLLPELKSLRSALQGTAQGLLNHAEGQGFSSDICNYLKADMGMHLKGSMIREKLLPPPALAVATTACNTYVKWAESWQRLYGMPLFIFDIPGSRTPDRPYQPGEAGFSDDLRYVETQLRALIRLCEDITGRRADLERLARALLCTDRMSRSFRRILELNNTAPACFDAVEHGTAYLGVFNAWRGTEAGARFFERVCEELALIKKQPQDQPQSNRPYRLLFVGIPCYPLYRDFLRMFHRHNGVFVASSYLLFASGGACAEVPLDPDQPVKSLAESLLTGTREAMDSMFLAGDRLLRMQAACRADGIVFHAVKSCRTVSSGLTDARLDLLSRCSLPTLLIESDMMDRRLVSAAQMQNRVDAFFETLALRRQGRAS